MQHFSCILVLIEAGGLPAPVFIFVNRVAAWMPEMSHLTFFYWAKVLPTKLPRERESAKIDEMNSS